MIDTYNDNGLKFDVEQVEKDGLELGNLLYEKCWKPGGGNDIVYERWKQIFPERNNGYGVETWKELGLRGIFCFLYSKYSRIVSIEKFEDKIDSFVDTFGYCLLASLYLKYSGVDFNQVSPLSNNEDNITMYEQLNEVLRPTLWKLDTIDPYFAASCIHTYLFITSQCFYKYECGIPVKQNPRKGRLTLEAYH